MLAHRITNIQCKSIQLQQNMENTFMLCVKQCKISNQSTILYSLLNRNCCWCNLLPFISQTAMLCHRQGSFLYPYHDFSKRGETVWGGVYIYCNSYDKMKVRTKSFESSFMMFSVRHLSTETYIILYCYTFLNLGNNVLQFIQAFAIQFSSSDCQPD